MKKESLLTDEKSLLTNEKSLLIGARRLLSVLRIQIFFLILHCAISITEFPSRDFRDKKRMLRGMFMEPQKAPIT